MARVISLINYKGGVGKSTTAVNISANLAKYHEQRVLLVDADPQTNATVCVMEPVSRYEPIRQSEMTSRKLYEECGKRQKSYKVEDLIVKGVVEKDGRKVLPGLDVLPSDPALIRSERWLTASNSPFTVLWEALDEVKDQYEYIIIDCAPNLYSLTKNCILASNYYVVPMIPDYLSTAGFQLLIKEIYDFSQDMIRTKPSPIQLKAVIFTKYRSATRMHVETIPQVKAWLANGFPEQGIAGGAVSAFNPPIADRIDNAYAQEANQPLCTYSPNCQAAIEYRQLTEEFENLFSAL